MKKKVQPQDSEPQLSVAAVDVLEKSLRLAAGAYYEAYPEKVPEQKSWMQNKPPGIVRRFEIMRDTLLPAVRHKKSIP